MVERHCEVATLFDTQFGAAVRKGCGIPVLIADHINVSKLG